MIVRPAKAGDEPKIRVMLERTGLALGGMDYETWTGVLLVAERQGEVIGMISALPGKPYAIVTHIAVLPEHQKGRAAYKLVESMELILRSMGCPVWVSYVWEKNMACRSPLEGWGAVTNGNVGFLYHKRLL